MSTPLNSDDFPLPEWASKRSDGSYLEAGAQLMTRDGRRFGNAYVDRIEQHEILGRLAVVVTDMGNLSSMTLDELEYGFFPPVYVMRVARTGVRYVLHPGYVTSATDGQEHFIGGPRLASLYGVDIRDREAVVFGDMPSYREQPYDVHLHPRHDGNYILPSGA